MAAAAAANEVGREGGAWGRGQRKTTTKKNVPPIFSLSSPNCHSPASAVVLLPQYEWDPKAKLTHPSVGTSPRLQLPAGKPRDETKADGPHLQKQVNTEKAMNTS